MQQASWHTGEGTIFGTLHQAQPAPKPQPRIAEPEPQGSAVDPRPPHAQANSNAKPHTHPPQTFQSATRNEQEPTTDLLKYNAICLILL